MAKSPRECFFEMMLGLDGTPTFWNRRVGYQTIEALLRPHEAAGLNPRPTCGTLHEKSKSRESWRM